jgi:hypothetical protein
VPRSKRPDINFLEIRPQQALDETRQLKEAVNVLSSYSHALDFLAEALQNATDAIDERLARKPTAPARIAITFDASQRTFTVVDTGIGMSEDDARIVLTPNVTTKAGRLARVNARRSRGEKGVGLSFLALASNYLHIRTCDGKARQDVTVRGGREWVLSEGDAEKPVGEHFRDDPDRFMGSSRYTAVTVGGLDPEEFDRDLFGYEKEELVWAIRTRTAVGNTRYLFERPFSARRHANEIDVSLTFIGSDGTKTPKEPIPYAYATPEELAPRRTVHDFDDIADLNTDEMVRRLRGAAVRYVRRFRTPSDRTVSIYAYITDGDEMRALLKRRRSRGKWVPDEWQGFFIATREMPTGVELGVNVIQPRTYERRIFVLIQEDGLVLDLGRKSLHGKTRTMLVDVVRRAWRRDLQKVVPRVGAEKETSDVDRAALKAAIARSLRRTNLDAPIPYLKTPDSRAGVIAVFHELVADGGSTLPRLRTLQTGTFGPDDSLIYPGDPDGIPPLHVLFGVRAADIVGEIETGDPLARTADLAVVWDLGTSGLSGRGIEVEEASDGSDGATHELQLRGIAGLSSLRVIALRHLLRSAE